MSEDIRILIVDDHAVVREGLRALIDVQPDMQLVGEAADGAEAVDRAHTLRPDVILLDLGLTSIRLLTNNPRKIVGLEGYGLEITGREPLRVEAGEFNRDYLATKRTKLGHIL